jgi:tRNA (guanine-N7-)-methyltransferase
VTERRRGLLYGRRKGPRLSAHQQHLVTELLPKLAIDLEPGCDPHRYFSDPVEDVWLEVGFGGGEHLVWQVGHHANIGMLGAEPYESGVAKLLSKLVHTAPPHQPSSSAEETSLVAGSLAGRIRIHEGDARDILEALPDASLGRVFILFPDPWPKTRHHKRRFMQMEMLDRLARVMRAGAEFRFATDDAGYLAWVLERLTAHPAFLWQGKRALDWTTRPGDWPATRYETKALHGPPAYLRFRRI